MGQMERLPASFRVLQTVYRGRVPGDLGFCGALALIESPSAGCLISAGPGTLDTVPRVLPTLSPQALLKPAEAPGPGAPRHVSSHPASPSPCPPPALALSLCLSLSLSTLPALRLRLSTGFGCLCLSVSFLPPYPFPPCVADSARPFLGTLGVQPCCKRAEQPPCGHRRSLKGPGPRMSTQANGALRGTEPIQTSRVVTDCLLAQPSTGTGQRGRRQGERAGSWPCPLGPREPQPC